MKNPINSVFFLLALLVVGLSCRTITGPVAPSIANSPVPPPADTSIPSPIFSTFTPEPSSTVTPIPSPTLIIMPVPTIIKLPQQWNGTYIYTGSSGATQHINLLIEKVDGNTFSGKMIWQSFGNYRGAILKMNGEFVTDFGDNIEQLKWSNLDDYNKEDKSGYWLKWTETEIIDGANYTVNGWYYAHIRLDGTMVAVYYYNDEETVPSSGVIVFEQAK